MPTTATPVAVQRELRLRAARFAPVTAGCGALFMLPFIAVGVFSISAALGHFEIQTTDGTDPRIFLAVFGSIFTFVGVVLAALMLSGVRGARREAARVRQHPDEPWMWREDWAAGRVEDRQSNASLVSIWVFAVLWCGASFPTAFLASKQADGNTGPLLLAMLFPLVGVILVVVAVRMTMRKVKYGRSILHLSSVPLRLGSTVNFTLETRALTGAEKIDFKLTCVKEEARGSGKQRRIHRTTLWESSREVPGGFVADAPTGSAVPVSFALPPDGDETQRINREDRVVWMLRASANVPGIDYSARFEVPVFSRGERS